MGRKPKLCLLVLPLRESERSDWGLTVQRRYVFIFRAMSASLADVDSRIFSSKKFLSPDVVGSKVRLISDLRWSPLPRSVGTQSPHESDSVNRDGFIRPNCASRCSSHSEAGAKPGFRNRCRHDKEWDRRWMLSVVEVTVEFLLSREENYQMLPDRVWWW